MAVFLKKKKHVNGNRLATVGVSLPFPISTLTLKSTQVLSKPGYLQSVTENMFGYDVPIKRISEKLTFGETIDGYKIDIGYSRRQGWSRNDTWLRVGNRHLLNGQTHEYIRFLSVNYKLWSNVVDDKMYVFSKTGQVQVYTPSTNVTSAAIIDLSTLPGYDATYDMTVGNFEGNISADDTRLILNIKQSGVLKNVVVNLITGAIVFNHSDATLGIGVDGSNNVSVSPSGLYIGVQRNAIATVSQPKTTYSIDGALVNSNLDTLSHRDMGYDENMNEILSGTSNPKQNNIITGAQIQMATLASMQAAFGAGNVSNGHSSMQASLHGGLMKGWCLIGCTGADATYKEIFWVKTDGSGQVMRVCNARISTNTYTEGPQSTPSRNGRQILFASDWGMGTPNPVDAYVVKV